MGKSAAARKPAAAPAAAPQPQAEAPKTHAPVELADFENAPAVTFEDNNQPMHGGMHDTHESEMHFGDEIHADDMTKNWAPPTQLEAPDARPGMVQRWIRSSLLGKSDAKNISLQGGQGWRPRAMTSVPEEQRKRFPTSKDARTGAEFMVNGDLVLCEMPERIFKQMQQHYRNRASSQVQALDDKLAGERVAGAEKHGMHAPQVVERHTKVTTRRPIVAAD